MEAIHVLIADDHTLFRAGMRALLNLSPDVQVIGEASSGEEAIAKAEALQPDVILMDIQMPGVQITPGIQTTVPKPSTPGVNGIEATRRILHTSPNIGVIVVTMFEDDGSVFSAMRAGARGYILKEADEEEVLRAIRAVARGEAIFSPGIARRLMQFFSNPPLSSHPVFPELTGREREILGLIARGENNAEIAGRLVLSPHTVRNHISNIFSKLQVADRAQAIIRAREAGLGN